MSVDERIIARLRVERKQIEVYERKLELARAKRDKTIIALCRRGYSEREVADIAGVSSPRVHQVKSGTTGNEWKARQAEKRAKERAAEAKARRIARRKVAA
jgi:transposase